MWAISLVLSLMHAGNGRPQAWARIGAPALAPSPLEMLKSVFFCKCCLKPQETKHWCIILRKCGQFLGASPQIPTGELPLDPAGTSVLQTPSLLTPGKKSCGARDAGWSANMVKGDKNSAGLYLFFKSLWKTEETCRGWWEWRWLSGVSSVAMRWRQFIHTATCWRCQRLRPKSLPVRRNTSAQPRQRSNIDSVAYIQPWRWRRVNAAWMYPSIMST